jgi:AraC-type DNA-binding domain-containing proteins
MFIEGLHEKDIYTRDFPFRLFDNCSVDFEFPMHWHNAVEIIYACKNAYKVNVNNMSLQIKEKDICFIAPGDIHGFSVFGCNGKRIFLQFDPSNINGLGLNAYKMPAIETGVISAEKSPDIRAALEAQLFSLINEYESKNFAYQYVMNARLLDMIAILSRSHLNKNPASLTAQTRNKIFGLEKINRALEYLEENYQNDINLIDIAKVTGFSACHFSRIFKEIMEVNFHSYLNGLRIKKAEKLLSESHDSIAHIAVMSGFNSFATFNRIFREVKGCTPTMYRKFKSDIRFTG